MISLDNLTISYGGWTLFDNISFLINPKDRIGLVGKNGAGKTTLLRTIVGEQQPTSGAVTVNGECTIGYLPQQMRVADTTTLMDETAKAFDEVLRIEADIERMTAEIAERTDFESAEYEALLHRLNEANDRYHILGGDTREADIERTLLGLGFRRSDFRRATSEFSGGWRMRIELAKLLLRRPSIFLLDEPTNHLDIDSREALEDALEEYEGTVVIVSHDRYFIEKLSTRLIDMLPVELGGGFADIGVMKKGEGYAELLRDRERRAGLASAAPVGETVEASSNKELYLKKKKETADARNAQKRLERLRKEAERIEGELDDIEKQMSGEAAYDYKLLSELDEKKNALEERLLEIYEEI